MKKLFKPGEFSEIEIDITDGIVKFYIYGAVFYDFFLCNWEPYYKKHMADKKWFTKQMADFITENIKP